MHMVLFMRIIGEKGGGQVAGVVVEDGAVQCNVCPCVVESIYYYYDYYFKMPQEL